MKTRKIILGLCLLFLGIFVQAQNGLENIYVERYYVADAIDAANSNPAIPVGAVTYRIYADMLPGYKVQTIFGIPAHPMTMTTTTYFFNQGDFGSSIPTFSATNAKKNTVMIDSWLSTGGACTGWNGVPKPEDNGVNNFVNSNVPQLLQNNAAQAGLPLTTQDGMLAGAVPTTGTLGIAQAMLDLFGDGTANGNTFLVPDGSWFCLVGAAGPIPASNKVLIAQITTDGIFHFELNIQIGTPTGGTENYVYSNPTGVELTIPSLIQTLFPSPAFPTVSITAPANGSTFSIGAPIAITADANDADGTVTQVEFFVDGVSIGVDASAPYSASYTGLAEASHVLTAIATDNDGQATTSAAVNFNVGNAPPTVSITSPVAGSTSIVGDVVAIDATAADSDGTVASVEFFVDGVSLSIDVVAPYTAVYTGVLGPHNLTAKATDNNGKFATSAPVSITVLANQLPSVAITAPVNGATPALNSPLTLTATAADNDGTVTSVEFFSGATSLGLGTLAAGVYSLTYTPSVQGPVVLTAKATDNKGGITTSAPVNVTITDNSVAYAVTFTTQVCNLESVCMPIEKIVTPVVNVNGYNFTVAYDNTKVVPTGNVTVSNELLLPFLAAGQNAEFITDYTTSIDAVAGKINIAIFFNTNGPVNAVFNGLGDVCCVEFTKTASFGSVDFAVFSLPEIIESYPAAPAALKTGSAGNFNTVRDETLSGNLKFWSDMSPIRYDAANPSAYLITNIFGCNSAVNAVQPDTSGAFTYNITNGTTIDVKRDIVNTTNVHLVINGQDSYLASLVSVKGTAQIGWTPSIYQMIAMDVNRDNLVTAGDATQINQRAVRDIDEFSQIDLLKKDWSFVANTVLASDLHYLISTTFPEDDGLGYSKYRVPVVAACQAVPVIDAAGCPLIQDENYIGILVGDVDASYETIANDGAIKSVADTTSEIIIDLEHAVLSNGNMMIPVSLTCNNVVNSFDFDLLINDLKASVASVESQYSFNYNWNYIDFDKMLSVAAFSTSPIPTENTVSLTLTLIGVETLTSSDLTGALALVNGEAANLKVIDATTGVPSETKENMVQVYPNPTSDKLNVEVSVASKVQLLDVNGKQVVAEQNVNSNQTQTIDVSNLAPGIYMVKIYNDKFVSMKKVVIKK